MPIRTAVENGFTVQPLIPEEKTSPDLFSTWGAAFHLENDVVNAYETTQAPEFARNPDYPIVQKLKESGLWDDYRDNFLNVQSDEEFNYVSNKIAAEQQQRDVLMRSGWSGTIAAVGSGVLSPTMLLPFMGQEKGLAAVGRGLFMGAVAGAAQEIPLQLNQETRSTEESLFAVGAATVLGGFLGGAHSVLLPGEEKAISESMANVRGTKPIPTPAGAAASAAEDAGQIAGGKIIKGTINLLDSNPVTRSPVTDAIMSDYDTARWSMAQLSDGGMMMERNAAGIPTSPGGTVENRVEPWYGNNVQGVKALDDQFADYVFNGSPPRLARDLRAWIEGARNKDKLTKSEFGDAVVKAGWNNDQHEIPQVAQAAAAIRAAVYEPIEKAMQEVGMLKDTIELLGDPSYINRLFNHDEIRRDPVAFVDFIADKYNTKLQQEFSQKLEGFRTQQARTDQLLEDVNLPQDRVDELRTEFETQLGELDKQAEPQHFTALEESIAALRGAARKITGTDLASTTQKKEMLASAREMEKAAGEPYAQYKGARRELNRRLSNLNKARVVLAEKLAKKVEKADRADELSMQTLNRAAKTGYKFLSEMDKWSDEVLDKKLTELKNQFSRAGSIFDKGEERLKQLKEGEDVFTTDLIKAAELQDQRAGVLTDLSERIADAEDLGRPAVRSLINDMLQASLERIKSINDRRAVRTAKLRTAAKDLDPAIVEERIGGIKATKEARARDFGERLRATAGNDFDLEKGVADFMPHAREIATEIKDTIQGTYIRLPQVDLMQGKRGAAMARALDIPSTEMSRWLITDPVRLMQSHVRTMAPDIEITRKFGTVNGEEQFRQLGEEMNAKLEAVKTQTDSKGKPLSEKAQQKEILRIQDEYARQKLNLEGVIGRLRHTWGLPNDPNGMAWRMGKVLMNLQVVRFMGGVTIASVPDVARPVMRYGLTRTFRDGWIPLVTNFKAIKMAAHEAKLAGVAVDAYTQSRAHALLDVTEDFRRGSKFERGLEYATAKQGLVAAYSYWTDAMKGLTSAIAIPKITQAIAEIATKDKPAAWATEYLAQQGVGIPEIDRLWKQLSNGEGGNVVRGVWFPNTEAWTDGEAKHIFRQMLAREINNTITTPGVERPLWTNQTTTGKMLSQFKSFAFASTYKTGIAGLQQRDMAFVNGTLVSLALGALSYYLYGVAKGGDTYERMQQADFAHWADQATQRSGIFSVFGLGQDLLSRIPATAPYVSFSGGRSVRRGGDDLVGALLGPSFDFASTTADVLSQIDDPTKSTVHKARTLAPWQNLIGFSRVYDAIENAVPVKETR